MSVTNVTAGITTSLDGYLAGPNDRPGLGMGEGGEQLHNWMFGAHRSDQTDDGRNCHAGVAKKS
jgi:hypothetical protein